MFQRPRENNKKLSVAQKNFYAMDTNLSGWGYPLSQALTFSSSRPGVAVDVSSSSLSAADGKARIRGDFSLFSLVFPFGDDTTTDSSNVGFRQ